MKKQLSILALLCAIGFGASAQTEKGKNFINGSLEFTTSKNKSGEFNQTITNTYYSIMPSYGHFFADNLAIGLSAGYGHYKSDLSYQQLNAVNGVISYSDANIYNTSNRYSVGPFVRYYVPIADQFKFFGQLNAGIGFGKSESNNNTAISYTSKLRTLQAGLTPGLTFFPAKKWAIEFGFNLISYSREKSSSSAFPDNNYTVNSFSFGLNTFTPKIGVNYHF